MNAQFKKGVLELIVLINSALEGTRFSRWQIGTDEYREMAE